MTAALVAGGAAAVLGPLTVLLARLTMRASWSPGVGETWAVVTLAGLLGLVAASNVSRPLPVVLPLALVGPAAAVVDAREGRLPNLLTVPLAGATLLGSVAAGTDLPRVLGGAVAVTLVGGVVAVLMRTAVGWGDVKLLPTVGLVLGARGALADGLVRTLLLLLLTVALVWVCDRRALVPYGPALVVGALGTSG